MTPKLSAEVRIAILRERIRAINKCIAEPLEDRLHDLHEARKMLRKAEAELSRATE